jgi:hypothetical protein
VKRQIRHRKSRIPHSDITLNIPEVQVSGKLVANPAMNKPLLEEEIPLTSWG